MSLHVLLSSGNKHELEPEQLSGFLHLRKRWRIPFWFIVLQCRGYLQAEVLNVAELNPNWLAVECAVTGLGPCSAAPLLPSLKETCQAQEYG